MQISRLWGWFPKEQGARHPGSRCQVPGSRFQARRVGGAQVIRAGTAGLQAPGPKPEASECSVAKQ